MLESELDPSSITEAVSHPRKGIFRQRDWYIRDLLKHFLKYERQLRSAPDRVNLMGYNVEDIADYVKSRYFIDWFAKARGWTSGKCTRARLTFPFRPKQYDVAS